MTDTSCVRCGRPMADQAYADRHCTDRAAGQLADIADMTGAARDIAHGLSKRSGGRGGSGKPGSRLPLDLTATAKLDSVQAALTRWVDHIGTHRGTTRPWFTPHGDPITTAATWLTKHLEWMRHRPDAGDFLTDVEAAARVVRSIARGPREQKYLGPCGAPTYLDRGKLSAPASAVLVESVMLQEGPPCEGDVYGPVGGHTGHCRTCGAEVTQDERTAWLDGEVRGHAFRAVHIADAYGVNPNTIRSWAARGLLVPHGHDGQERPLFNVGDVLDLAAADAARRETERAKRERRAATRAAEDERLSA